MPSAATWPFPWTAALVPAFRRVLTLLMLAALAICIGCHLPLRKPSVLGRRSLARARRVLGRRESRPLWASPAELLGSRCLVEVAFDYQREVLELEGIDPDTKERALFLVSRVIVPLLGDIDLANLTSQLEAGIEAVLATQFPVDPNGAVFVFRDLIRWGRLNSVRRSQDQQPGPQR